MHTHHIPVLHFPMIVSDARNRGLLGLGAALLSHSPSIAKTKSLAESPNLR